MPKTTAVPGIDARHLAAVMLIVFLAAVIPFAGSFEYPLLHDDNMAVVNNPLVDGRMVDLKAIFSTTGWGDVPEYRHVANYRPLATTTLAVTRYLFGLKPAAFRIANVTLYAAACMLLAGVMLALGFGMLPSAIASTWFALHGTHVETVMFAVNREIILVLLFYLSGLLLVIRRSTLVRAPRRWTARSVAGLAALTLGGLLSKESAITMPFVAAMIVIIERPAERPLKDSVAPIVAMVLAVVFYFIARLMAVGSIDAAAIPWQDNPLVLSAWPQRLAGAMQVLLEAARLLIMPTAMTVDYGFDVLGLPGPLPGTNAAGIAGGAALLVSGLILLVILVARRARAWPGIMIMALSWGLVSSILFPNWIILGERLMTEPSAGMAIGIAAGLAAIRKSALSWPGIRPAFAAAAAVTFAWNLMLGAIAFDRVGDYTSAEALFKASLANRPGSTRLHNNVGKAMMDDGRWAEAEPWLRKAVEIDPANAEAHNNLALVLGNAGMPGSAIAELQAALTHRPGMPAALANLCIILAAHDHCQDALPICRQARQRGADVDSQIVRCEGAVGP